MHRVSGVRQTVIKRGLDLSLKLIEYKCSSINLIRVPEKVCWLLLYCAVLQGRVGILSAVGGGA